MSVTWNSSKHSSHASSKIAFAVSADHVGIGNLAARDVLPVGVDALMHLGHEFVEMRAALVRDRALLEEQIHQHGLAAADVAVDIEPARRRLVLVGRTAARAGSACSRACSRKAAAPARQRLPPRAPAPDRPRSRLRRRGLCNGHGTRRAAADSMAHLTALSVRKLQAENWVGTACVMASYAAALGYRPSLDTCGRAGVGAHALSA